MERRLDSAAAAAPDGADRPDGPDPGAAGLLRDVAARRLDQLDALPDDIGERIRALRL